MTAVDQVREYPVVVVAEAFGASIVGRGSIISITPCPACGDDQRGYTHRDTRGPVGITPDGHGWRCHRCRAGGDSVSFAAYAVCGDGRPRGPQFIDVLVRCAELGLCDRPTGASTTGSGAVTQRRPLPPPRPPAPPNRPAPHDVWYLLREAVPVTWHNEVSVWLRDRGLDPVVVADRELAYGLTPITAMPVWGHAGAGPWSVVGYRCLLPLYDATGRVVSVRARAVAPGLSPKAVNPAGKQVAGTVLADPLARALLSGDADAAETVRRVGIVIAEGDPDFLTWATVWSDADDAPAVFGLVEGGWTDEVSACVPTGTRVAVRTHPDPAGDRYAAGVFARLRDRCLLYRPVPDGSRRDDNDRLRDGDLDRDPYTACVLLDGRPAAFTPRPLVVEV